DQKVRTINDELGFFRENVLQMFQHFDRFFHKTDFCQPFRQTILLIWISLQQIFIQQCVQEIGISLLNGILYLFNIRHPITFSFTFLLSSYTKYLLYHNKKTLQQESHFVSKFKCSKKLG